MAKNVDPKLYPPTYSTDYKQEKIFMSQIQFDKTDVITFDPNLERVMDRCCQALVSRFFWFPNSKPWIPSVLTN